MKTFLSLFSVLLLVGVSEPALAKKKAVTGVYFSAKEGEKIPGGRSCRGKFKLAGSLADCGGGPCYGNQTICKKQGKGRNVILDMKVLGYGQKIPGGPSCGAGYEVFGSAADCSHGRCYGNHVFCAKWGWRPDVRPNQKIVTDFYFTREGAKQVYPKCARGFEARGAWADCGGGPCYGSQQLCVKKVKKKKLRR